MEAGTTTPVIHTGPIKTSDLGNLLRYPLYPQMAELLIGDGLKEETNCVDILLLKRISFKHFWKDAYEPTPLFGVTYEKDFDYNDETLYSDYFRNLKIADGSGLSLKEFFDLPFDLATDILDKEITRAEKEIKEEKTRKAKQEAETRRKEMQTKLKGRK